MIIDTYSAFRTIANPGGPIDLDGMTEFDPDRMRADGFDDGLTVSATEFPFVVSCNAEDYDLPAWTDGFDWYVSQGTSIDADKPFIVSRFDNTFGSRSGSIEIDLATWAETEYPDPFDLSTIRVLFFGIDIYVVRRSDFAIQRIDLMRYFIDALTPKTNIE